MSGAVIKKCGCSAANSDAAKYQDKQYGEGHRVCCLDQKKTEAVCTICGKTHKA